MDSPARIHTTAEVDSRATVGPGCAIWNQVQVREGAVIGSQTSIGKNSYVDAGVRIGSRCKIQNNVSIFHGVTVEDGVFLGPHVCFTNDKVPRAINPDGTRKDAADWVVRETVVEYGASVGAGAIILPGVTLGSFCLIAAGSVVTRSVPPNGLVAGNPARLVGWVCACGGRQPLRSSGDEDGTVRCPDCGEMIRVHRPG